MGKVKKFVIRVNEGETCVIPDASGYLTVSGSLVIDLAVAVQVNYLKLSFNGESRCRWDEGPGNNRRPVGSLDLLFKEEWTFIKAHDSAPVKLTAGSHVYPFIFHIRKNRHLPSSCVGSSDGSIKYFLHARMDRVGTIYCDYKNKFVNVHNPMVLNISQYMRPVTFNKEHMDRYLCCVPGCVIVNATIDRTVLTLRSLDRIEVTLIIDNLMSKSLRPKVYLEEERTFKADGYIRRRTTKLCQVESEIVRPHTTSNLVKVKLGPVFDHAIGSVQSVKNIFVEYKVLVKLKGSEFEMRYPIMMGVDGNAGPRVTPNQIAMGYTPGSDETVSYPPRSSAYPPVSSAYPPVNSTYPPSSGIYPNTSSIYPETAADSELPPPPPYHLC